MRLHRYFERRNLYANPGDPKNNRWQEPTVAIEFTHVHIALIPHRVGAQFTPVSPQDRARLSETGRTDLAKRVPGEYRQRISCCAESIPF